MSWRVQQICCASVGKLLEVDASRSIGIALPIRRGLLGRRTSQSSGFCEECFSKGRESLAWGSVQLSCERTIGAQHIHADRPTTAIAKSASTVYSSLPVILFCDVSINAGEQKTFTCEIGLPKHGLPPSFRGQLVKYLNRITVAVQHVRAPIKLVHLQLRVIPAVGLETHRETDENPFLLNGKSSASISEIVSSAVDHITAPRKPHVFNMTNSTGKVTTLTLFKKAYRLGDDIMGHLDFADSTVSCVQYAVTLETVERMAEDTIGDDGEKRVEGRTYTVVHAQEHSVCGFAADGTFRLGIPLQASPTFHTDTVHLKWRLRFEFVTSNKKLFETNAQGLSTAPIDVPIETLTWQIDVFVLPCSPENAALTDHLHTTMATMVI